MKNLKDTVVPNTFIGRGILISLFITFKQYQACSRVINSLKPYHNKIHIIYINRLVVEKLYKINNG